MSRSLLVVLVVCVALLFWFAASEEGIWFPPAPEGGGVRLVEEVDYEPGLEPLPTMPVRAAAVPRGYAPVEAAAERRGDADRDAAALAQLLDYEIEVARSLPTRRERIEWTGGALLPLAIHCDLVQGGASAPARDGDGEGEEPWLFACQGVWHAVERGRFPLFDAYASAASSARGASDDFDALGEDFEVRAERFALAVLGRLRAGRLTGAGN